MIPVVIQPFVLAFYFLVQKNAFFCTKQLILLYKRKQSFVQENINHWRKVYFCRLHLFAASVLYHKKLTSFYVLLKQNRKQYSEFFC
jgi:hypothetical protein